MKLTTYLTAVVLTATALFSNGALATDNTDGTPCGDCETQYWNCWDVSAPMTRHSCNSLIVHSFALRQARTWLVVSNSVACKSANVTR